LLHVKPDPQKFTKFTVGAENVTGQLLFLTINKQHWSSSNTYLMVCVFLLWRMWLGSRDGLLW